MAEETQAQASEQQASGVDNTDWQAKYEAMRAHSREWEKKAKENQGAADELEKLRESQATEQEKATKRAERAEAELNELKAKAERAEAVQAVADKANVPAEVVSMLNGSDVDELGKQVERLLKLLPAYPTRTDDGGGRAAAKKSTAEMFADAIKIF